MTMQLPLSDVRLTLVDADWPDNNNDDATTESEADRNG